jgi:hypothetical protein
VILTGQSAYVELNRSRATKAGELLHEIASLLLHNLLKALDHPPFSRYRPAGLHRGNLTNFGCMEQNLASAAAVARDEIVVLATGGSPGGAAEVLAAGPQATSPTPGMPTVIRVRCVPSDLIV